MRSDRSSQRKIPVKIVVAGGFGVGKTTFVGAISEIEPLRSEAIITEVGAGIDRLDPHSTKTETTVAMDFGRIGLKHDLVLYLFGTPGQDRFHFMWNELARGAIGAVVLVDTREIEACFPAIDFFERRGTPFIVAINTFNGRRLHTVDEVRSALRLDRSIPIRYCDARLRDEVKAALVALVEHAIVRTVGDRPGVASSRETQRPALDEERQSRDRTQSGVGDNPAVLTRPSNTSSQV